MTTPTASAKKLPRRWFSPRFSLRMLILLVTAAAIGSAFWWRWPVTRITVKRLGSQEFRETYTYHRGFSGNLIKHGMHRTTIDGELDLEEHYSEGVRHGPYRKAGQATATGEFAAGKRHGIWEFTSGQQSLTYEFKKGRLVAAPSSPSGRLLLRRITQRSLTSETIKEALLADVDLFYLETPLQEVIADLRDRFQLPLAHHWMWKTKVNPKERSRGAVEIYDSPITVNVKTWPLLAGFDVILSPLELAMDYRFGVLCVVDAEGAEDWQDQTGAMELRPASATLLASRLDSPAKPTCLEPLRDVLRNLAADQGISVKFHPADDPNVVMRSIPEDEMVGLFREVVMTRNDPSTAPPEPLPITLRQLLGLLLDQANLHCHEENGMLIIEPPLTGAAIPVKKTLP
jgi:hypothetical protein